jgi:uncharacterized membrane protein YebE (DUF533 family)
MSFMKTLLAAAAGFAAAKGYDKYREIGGMDGLQKILADSQAAGGSMTDQVAAMMEQLGMGGSARAMQDMVSGMGLPERTAQMQAAALAGMGGLMAAMKGTADATGKTITDMMQGFGAASPASDIAEANARLMLRAMIQAAKADGEIDAAERATILDHLGDVSDAERAFVEEQLDAPVDYAALAADTSDEMKAQVYAAALMAIRVDKEAEANYLNGLALALGLDDATRQKPRVCA